MSLYRDGLAPLLAKRKRRDFMQKPSMPRTKSFHLFRRLWLLVWNLTHIIHNFRGKGVCLRLLFQVDRAQNRHNNSTAPLSPSSKRWTLLVLLDSSNLLPRFLRLPRLLNKNSNYSDHSKSTVFHLVSTWLAHCPQTPSGSFLSSLHLGTNNLQANKSWMPTHDKFAYPC